MLWLGWGLFMVTLIFYIGATRISHARRTELRGMIIYLMMDDASRLAMQKHFKDWVQDASPTDAMDLSLKAMVAVEDYAKKFGKVSLMGAHSLLWNCAENRLARERLQTSVNKANPTASN